jgi:cation:H+ antiporter
MISHLLIYFVAFIGIWMGSGLAARSVERLAKSLKTSSFILSFIVLGIFTSISELSVGISAVVENDPEFFVGNLLGATIVLFLLIIPLLAIIGKSIRITAKF